MQCHAASGEAVGAADSDVATYPATEGLSSTQILALVREWRGAAQEALEPLPARMRVRDGLPDRPAALDAAHFGDHEGGRRRLAYDELLLLQIALLRRRARRREGSRATPLEPPGELTARWLKDSLPFEPTADQRKAMAAVDDELVRDRPMQRLLMGEVGSGKTVVAVYAMLRAVESGAPGRADGADRDARRAALRHAAGADARRAGAGRAAHRARPRRAAAPTCSASSPAAS